MKSRQETGTKAEKGETNMSNRTRQNNKRADRKMELNDSPEIPDREETSEDPGLPSGQKNKSLRPDFESIKYR